MEKNENDANHGVNMTGFCIINNYGDLYNVLSGATVIAAGAGKAVERKHRMDENREKEDNEVKRHNILEYVNRLSEVVAITWKDKYNPLWERIVELKSVSQTVYVQGKQQGTTFNRNLVGNIIHYLADKGIYKEVRAQRLSVALESTKNHSIRASLGEMPPKDVREELDALLKSL